MKGENIWCTWSYVLVESSSLTFLKGSELNTAMEWEGVGGIEISHTPSQRKCSPPLEGGDWLSSERLCLPPTAVGGNKRSYTRTIQEIYSN